MDYKEELEAIDPDERVRPDEDILQDEDYPRDSVEELDADWEWDQMDWEDAS